MPFCSAMLCTSRSTRSMFGAPANSARAADDGRCSDIAPPARIFRTAPGPSARAPSSRHSSTHPVVDRARRLEVGVHRLLDRSRLRPSARSDSCRRAASPTWRAARTPIVHLELHRQLDRRVAGIEARRFDVRARAGADRGVRVGIEARRLEVGRQRTCSTFTFSSGGRNACGSGLHSVISFGSKLVPDAWHRCRQCVQLVGVEAGMRFEIGQRRHVHDRHARHLRDFATASSSSRTPGERYCGSCIARATRS